MANPEIESAQPEHYDYDVFLSHASEDKELFVEPLARELTSLGVRVWYDKFALRVGDSLRRSIDMGLAKSEFGVVIFSPAFFRKKWPQRELDGLFALEMQGRDRILPILHEMSHETLVREVVTLGDKWCLASATGVSQVAKDLLKIVKPQISILAVAQEAAARTSSKLRQIGREAYPGFDFRISNNNTHPLAKDKHRVASLTTGDLTIDILAPLGLAAIEKPPSARVSFEGEGIAKYLRMVDSGRPQIFTSGEYISEISNLPFCPTHFPIGTELHVSQDLSDIPTQTVRVVFRVGPDSVRFPCMEMRPTRLGEKEGEMEITRRGSGLAISFTLLKQQINGVNDTQLSLRSGDADSFTDIAKAAKAIRLAGTGSDMKIYDLESDKLILGATFSPFDLSAVDESFERYVEAVAAVEKHFGMTFDWNPSLSEYDATALTILRSLITGSLAHPPFAGTCTLVKSRDCSIEELVAFSNCLFRYTEKPAQYPGFIEFLGKQINMPEWSITNDSLRVSDVAAFLEAFSKAQIGEPVEFDLASPAGAVARWVQ